MDNMFLNACKNAQKGIVQVFLKKGGINVDKRDSLGNTPLYYVCNKGAKDIAKLLVDAGADVNLANNSSEMFTNGREMRFVSMTNRVYKFKVTGNWTCCTVHEPVLRSGLSF